MLILDQIENEMTNYLRQLMEGKKREGRGGGEKEKKWETLGEGEGVLSLPTLT